MSRSVRSLGDLTRVAAPYVCVQISTFGGPRETCQYGEPYWPWQPHFRENIFLEVLSFLIFNASPGAQDNICSLHVPKTWQPVCCADASSHGYCLPRSFILLSSPLSTPALKQMATNYTSRLVLKVL